MRHALKNSLIPVVTILGPLFAAVLTGTFVIEQIFGIPGMGRHFIQSVGNRDYPIVMGTTLVYGVAIVVANLVRRSGLCLARPPHSTRITHGGLLNGCCYRHPFCPRSGGCAPRA